MAVHLHQPQVRCRGVSFQDRTLRYNNPGGVTQDAGLNLSSMSYLPS
jgi:hypothetical protein